jgi:Flp pilus assembly protein TadD
MSQTIYAPVKDSITSDIISSANLKYKQGDYLGSLTEYTEAIHIDPTNALAFCCRGVAYYRLGDEENAKIDYNRSNSIRRWQSLTTDGGFYAMWLKSM